MKRCMLFSLLAGTLLWGAAVAAQETETVESTGQAAIIDGDKAAARDKAIDDALRKAVESAVGTMVSAETITENYQLISDRIYSQAEGYVQKYRISEEREEDGVYIVEVRATVATGAVSKDLEGLKTLMRRKGMPKAIIMIAEQNVGMNQSEYWWGKGGVAAVSMRVVETTLMEEMKKKGFTFVDPEVFSGKVKVKMPVAKLSDKQALRVASTSEAQIIIVGQAVARDIGDVGKAMDMADLNMRSAHADVQVRVINTDNGKVLAAVQTEAKKPNMSATTAGKAALKAAARRAAKEIIEQVTKVWAEETSGINTVRMSLTGFQNRRQLADFVKILRNQVRSVKDVREDRMSSGQAVLSVDLAGDTRALATELEAKDFGGKFRIEVVEVTGNALKVKLIP